MSGRFFEQAEDPRGQVYYEMRERTTTLVGIELAPRPTLADATAMFQAAFVDLVTGAQRPSSYLNIRSTIERLVPPSSWSSLFALDLGLSRPIPVFDDSPRAAFEAIEFSVPTGTWKHEASTRGPSRAFIVLKDHALRSGNGLRYHETIALDREPGEYGFDLRSVEPKRWYRYRPLRVEYDGTVRSNEVDRSAGLDSDSPGSRPAHLDALLERVSSVFHGDGRVFGVVVNPSGRSVGLAERELARRLAARYPKSVN